MHGITDAGVPNPAGCGADTEERGMAQRLLSQELAETRGVSGLSTT
jgi:hypothetical protein